MHIALCLKEKPGRQRLLLGVASLAVYVTLTAGCGSYQLIEDRSDHYMHAQQGSELVVPDWYSQRRLIDRYPIPKADKSFVITDEFQVPAPPEPGIAMLQQQFIIKTAQEDTWLLATEPPGKMWPALKAYWENIGADVDELNTTTGLMAVTFQNNSLKARQFMENTGLSDFGDVVVLDVLVEQGLKRRSSEIRINAIANQSVTQALEQQLLANIGLYLEDRKDSLESYSLAAQNIGSRDRLVLINEPDKLYLKVDLTYDRVWHAVGEALTRSKIPIVDWNRKQGIYYVSYQGAASEEGWLPGWLAFNSDKQLPDEFNFKIALSVNADGIHIVSIPVAGAADDQDRIRLLNELLDHMS